MNEALQVLAELRQRGIRVEPATGGKLRLTPARAADPALLEKVRAFKAELLALVTAAPIGTADSPVVISRDEENAIDRLALVDGWQPDPRVPETVRSEIARIEREALRLGWSRERLWVRAFWPDQPRGLAAVLQEEDEIAEVAAGYITILRARRSLLRFPRCDG